MGDNVPFFGDHVELSDGGNDFASTVGVGGVVGTQFVLPSLGHKARQIRSDSGAREGIRKVASHLSRKDVVKRTVSRAAV